MKQQLSPDVQKQDDITAARRVWYFKKLTHAMPQDHGEARPVVSCARQRDEEEKQSQTIECDHFCDDLF